MRPPSHERCSAEKRASGMCKVEQVATYRELMRLQHQLSDDVVRYKNEIHALLNASKVIMRRAPVTG